MVFIEQQLQTVSRNILWLRDIPSRILRGKFLQTARFFPNQVREMLNRFSSYSVTVKQEAASCYLLHLSPPKNRNINTK